MSEFVKNIDMFGAAVPGINMRGKTELNTSCGAIISMLIIILTLSFGLLKLEHLMERKNPLIVTNTVPLDSEEQINTGSDNFMMAFAAVGKKNKNVKNDPRFVRWYARFWQIVDGEYSARNVPLNLCTDKEFAMFDPPEDAHTAETVKNM